MTLLYSYPASNDLVVEWSKDGHVIIESERIRMNKEDDVTYFLQVSTATLDDAGKYHVVIKNNNVGGSMAEAGVEVTVKLADDVSSVTEEEDVDAKLPAANSPEEEDKVDIEMTLPQFSVKPQDVIVTEGENIQLKFKLVQGTSVNIQSFSTAL